VGVPELLGAPPPGEKPFSSKGWSSLQVESRESRDRKPPPSENSRRWLGVLAFGGCGGKPVDSTSNEMGLMPPMLFRRRSPRSIRPKEPPESLWLIIKAGNPFVNDLASGKTPFVFSLDHYSNTTGITLNDRLGTPEFLSMRRRSTSRRRRYFKVTETLGCAHRAKIYDGVNGVDGAPSLKRGWMGRMKTTELSGDGERRRRRVGSSEAFRRRRRCSVDGEFGKVTELRRRRRRRRKNSQVCLSYETDSSLVTW
jgi:hypothetical protein